MALRIASSRGSNLSDVKPIDDQHISSITICKKVIIACLAVIVGFMIVTEAGINISLSKWTQHPLRASFITFLLATSVLFPFSIFCKSNKVDNDNDITNNKWDNLKTSLKKNKQNYFVFANGSCSIIWVCSLIFIAPQIGFALFIISAIMGQIIASMLIDNYGLIWSNKHKLSILNIFGAILGIFGVIIFQIPHFQYENESNVHYGVLLVYTLIAFVAGICITIQSALNRRLQNIINGTSYQSSFLSFLNGTLLLFIINIIIYIIQNDWFQVDNEYFEWYIFFGGIMGSFSVTMFIICPSYIGFVATYICSIFGQLTTSLLYDVVSAFGINTNKDLSVLKIVGVLSVFCGTIMVNVKRVEPAKPRPAIKPPYKLTVIDMMDEKTEEPMVQFQEEQGHLITTKLQTM